MNWFNRLWFVRASNETLESRIRIGIDKVFGELEIAMIAANVRVHRFDSLGRLTHTQEILRAQALEMAKTYRKVLQLEFKAKVVKAVVTEVLR